MCFFFITMSQFHFHLHRSIIHTYPIIHLFILSFIRYLFYFLLTHYLHPKLYFHNVILLYTQMHLSFEMSHSYTTYPAYICTSFTIFCHSLSLSIHIPNIQSPFILTFRLLFFIQSSFNSLFSVWPSLL